MVKMRLKRVREQRQKGEGGTSIGIESGGEM